MAGRDGYVLSHDPESRITTRMYDVEGVSKTETIFGRVNTGRIPTREGSRAVVQVIEQDVRPILDHMGHMRAAASSWRPATSGATGPCGMQFIGRIPNFMLPWLRRRGILQDQQLFRRFMDSDIMKPFRANTFRVG